MIPVALQNEPPTFAARVKNPGAAFLRRYPNPTREEWKKGQFWNECLPDLRTAYRNICAYCCFYVGLDASVDHFLPKATNRHLAYEWRNYRLAHSKINSYKGNSVGIADPFAIQPGWFTLDFDNCFVKPNPSSPSAVQKLVGNTITVLRLNRDDTLVQQRFSIVRNYAQDHCDMDFLEGHYPFIAAELKRQGVQDSIKGTIS